MLFQAKPPSWTGLLATKITAHNASYAVMPLANGDLQVERPKLGIKLIAVNEIALFCQRGPKDCNYATDQMLLDLDRP